MTNMADELAISDGEWKPIPRISRVIPFGYIVDPEDANTLLPVGFELKALEEAKKHLKRFSYRVVANWLSTVTERPISHMGLKKRVEIEQSRRTKASALKVWAKRIEEIRSKIEKHENGTGSKT
jgi:hypothetical protein